MSSQKIQTKKQAIDFLNELIMELEEVKFFLPQKDLYFTQIAQNNLTMMINSINHSEDFFNNIFQDKTKSDIKKWIDKESRKW